VISIVRFGQLMVCISQVVDIIGDDQLYRGVTGCEVLKQDNVRLIKNKIQIAVINMIKQRMSKNDLTFCLVVLGNFNLNCHF